MQMYPKEAKNPIQLYARPFLRGRPLVQKNAGAIWLVAPTDRPAWALWGSNGCAYNDRAATATAHYSVWASTPPAAMFCYLDCTGVRVREKCIACRLV
jgi:hypothetical protein